MLASLVAVLNSIADLAFSHSDIGLHDGSQRGNTDRPKCWDGLRGQGDLVLCQD